MRFLNLFILGSVVSVTHAASTTTSQVIDKVSTLITVCWEECHPSLHPQVSEALGTLSRTLPKTSPQVESFDYDGMEGMAKSQLIVALRAYYMAHPQSRLSEDLPYFAMVMKYSGFAKAVLSKEVKREVRQLMLAVSQEEHLPERLFLYAFKNNLCDEFKGIFNVMRKIDCDQLVRQRGPFSYAFMNERDHRMAVEWAGTIYFYSVYSPALTDADSEEKAEYRRVIVKVLMGITDKQTAKELLFIYSGGQLLKILDHAQKEHFLATAGALEIYRQYGLI
jgi:hypothetical protein